MQKKDLIKKIAEMVMAEYPDAIVDNGTDGVAIIPASTNYHLLVEVKKIKPVLRKPSTK